MLGEVKIIIQDVRDSDGGYCQGVPDIPSLDQLVLDFRQGKAFLRDFEEGWTDICRFQVQRAVGSGDDQIIIFWPSWADEESKA